MMAILPRVDLELLNRLGGYIRRYVHGLVVSRMLTMPCRECGEPVGGTRQDASKSIAMTVVMTSGWQKALKNVRRLHGRCKRCCDKE